ncbi:U3 small nucleolar RNA-associated protein 4 homolog [Drosophila biarmipes]|uniref:U3 small nucleolar RNA-associated protein 4 homolog n=1 Tax=Drosophila biarmipes TaxID=125945 RepID=UPI0007E75CED|nr:U3 small nucleolar RNA-associated protein 4 homolog [Drosophila biarmipes]
MSINGRKEPQGGGKQQLHNVRFYTIKPSGIVSMAYSKSSKFLALSRQVLVLELWNLEHAPYLDRVIHLPIGSPIESLAWAGNRLFSVDLGGKLIEWDWVNLKPRYEHSPTGNALWSLDVNPAGTELAVGSEEGHINLLSIENDEITYKSIFNKQNGRVLCLKFDKTGTKLVTGTEGFVRIWNVLKGTTLHTMTLSSKDVIVWSLQFLSDNTIIAGDSAGYVTVWNAENGTQIDHTQVLDKNVFSLAVNEKEDRLVCCGMRPPLIRIFSKTQIKREESTSERWIKYLQRGVHKHYVRSLLVIDGQIFSGGLDGILTVTNSERMGAHVSRHGPFVKGPVASLAPSKKLLLLRYAVSLHLWRLGSAAPQDKDKKKEWGQPLGGSEELVLEQPPKKLLQLNVKKRNFIQASAISPDAKWICYSTLTELRLNRLQINPLQVERLMDLRVAPASHIIFTKQDGLALLHPKNNHLSWFTLKEDGATFKSEVDLSDHCKSIISHLVVSTGADYLVAGTVDKTISVWSLQGKQYKHLLNLPRHLAGITALAMHEDHPRVVVAYANGQIVEYDLANRIFTCETEEYLIPDTKHYPIRGINLDPTNPNVFLVNTETDLYVLERNYDFEPKEQVIKKKTKKLSKETRSSVAANPKSLTLKTQLPRQHLVHVSRLSPNELVNVSISTNNMLAPLPRPYKRKTFGTG